MKFFSCYSEEESSANLERLMSSLFAINRTLMGKEFERSLELISELFPLAIFKIATGTPCGSWTIPEVWHVNSAWIDDDKGRRIIDFLDAPFMVWQYSDSVNKRVSLQELREHLAIGPVKSENALPLVVTYYKRRWGVSLSANIAINLREAFYNVHIDSVFKPGYLSLGSSKVQGKNHKVIILDAVLSCASLANNLTGVVLLAELGRILSATLNLRYSYRILFTPETIGPIAIHYHFPEMYENVIGGLTLSNLGFGDEFTFRQSRTGSTIVDEAVKHVFLSSPKKSKIVEYDVQTGTCGNEKAFNSLGIEIPIGALRRAALSSYPEYDTSADDLSLIKLDLLNGSLQVLLEIIYTIEHDQTYIRTFEGEPFLTGYGIFPDSENERYYFDYLMGFSDGHTSLLQIANRAGVPIWKFERSVELMCVHGLLKLISE